MLPRETTAGESAFAPYAGGAIFNTAVALGRLGVPTGFFTGLSDDMFGDILRATLEAANVDFAPCATLPLHTTLAFVKLVSGHGFAELRGAGFFPPDAVFLYVRR